MAHIHELIDFTVAAFIVFENKVLLVDHKELKTWLPVGGHIELNEDPEDALFREIEEEAGLLKDQLTVLSDKPSLEAKGTKMLLRPNYLHDINDHHKHIGMVYIIKSSTDKITLAEAEHHNIDWFSVEELETLGLRDSIIFYATKALEMVKERS